MPDLGIKLSIPSDYDVITRYTDESDPILEIYELSKDDVQNTMAENNMFLDAFDKFLNTEINITAQNIVISDIDEFDNESLASYAKSMTSLFEKTGFTDINVCISRHNKVNYMKHIAVRETQTMLEHIIQYCTIYQNRLIMITFKSYSRQTDNAIEQISNHVINSIVFSNPSCKLLQGSQTSNSFTYKDENNLAFFSIPDNWIESPSSKSALAFDVSFSSPNIIGSNITYVSFDLWNTVSRFIDVDGDRSDIDNNMYTISSLASEIGVPQDCVSISTYGDNSFYIIDCQNSDYSDYPPGSTLAIYINNGVMYLFVFVGSQNDMFYNDFEHVLLSFFTFK